MFNEHCPSVPVRSCCVECSFGTRSNVNDNLYVPNVKRDSFKQLLVYTVTVIWNNLPSFLKRFSGLYSFKKLDMRRLRK